MTEQTQEQNQEDERPECFESDEQWGQYQLLWRLSQGMAAVRFCTDCLPEYRDRMIAEGRCAHPETVFVHNGGEVIGVNGDRWSTWLGAISGTRGPVVSPPARIVRDKFIADAYRSNRGGKYKRMKVPIR